MYQSIQVKPLSRRAIRLKAERLRTHFQVSEPFFPLMRVLERDLPLGNEDFVLEVWSERDMHSEFGSDTHAMTYPDEMRMILREDVYHGARRGSGRDRFTVAHEFGHLELHDVSGLPRRMPTRVPIFENPEWQADNFASELLMPLEFVLRCNTAHEIVQRFGVSYEAANVRLDVLRQEGLLHKK